MQMHRWFVFLGFSLAFACGCLPSSLPSFEATFEPAPPHKPRDGSSLEHEPLPEPAPEFTSEPPSESPPTPLPTPPHPFFSEATCNPPCTRGHVCEDVFAQPLGRCVPLPPPELGSRLLGQDCFPEESSARCDGSKGLVCHALKCKKTCVPYTRAPSCAPDEHCVPLTFLSPAGGVCLQKDFFSPQIQGKFDSACGLSLRGRLSCWGPHYDCHLLPPDPSGWPPCALELTPHPHTQPFVAFSQGFGPLCGLTSDGALWCKGSYGDEFLSPFNITRTSFSKTWHRFQSDQPLLQVAAFSLTVFALSQKGHVGANPAYLGYGFPSPQDQIRWLPSLRHAVQISVFSSMLCALLRDGTVRCIEHSIGSLTPILSVSQLPGLERVVSLTPNAPAALREDGRAFYWGYPNEAPKLLPKPSRIRQLVVTSSVLCALLAGETSVFCWDSSPFPRSQSSDLGRGELKRSLTPEEQKALQEPMPVVGLTGVVSLFSGSGTAYVKTSDGTFLGWGWNERGEVGDGTTKDRYTPVKLLFQP